MAYGVYSRKAGTKYPFGRASEMVVATKGKFKGELIPKDLRFERLEDAEKEAEKLRACGREVKIKEVK